MKSTINYPIINDIYLLYMIHPTHNNKREFAVIQNYNIYNVNISTIPLCTCGYSMCNHMFFVMKKIINYNKIKKRYTKKELEHFFCNISTSIIMDSLYDNIISQGHIVQQINNNICPVCLNNINNIDIIDHCKYSCGYSIHIDCLNIWNNMNPYGYHKCLHCNVDWNIDPYDKSKNNNDNTNDNNNDNSDDNYNDNNNDNSDDNYNDNNVNEQEYEIVYEYRYEIIIPIQNNMEEQLTQLTVRQLKELCRDNNLPVSGNKASLIARLIEHYK
jgi:hypothetical protein